MIVEFVFITSISQFPQDLFERVKDNTLAIHSQVTWHFINEKENVICYGAPFCETKIVLNILKTVFLVCAASARNFPPVVLS